MNVLRRKWVMWFSACIAIVMLSGCMKEKPIIDQLAEDGSGALRVMYYDEEQFYREYGNYFSFMYPNVEIEVVSMDSMNSNMDGGVQEADPDKLLLDFIEKEQPDIIMTSMESMGKLVEQGKLYDLDPIIKQEQYSLDDMLPGLIDMLREKSNGSGLYGMTPSYYTQVLFYNADLFKEHGIEPPRNQMSWKEILELGARFGNMGSGDDQIYGIDNQYRDAMNFLFEIAQANNLQFVDASGEKVLIDSEGWREAFNMLVNGVNNKAVKLIERNEDGGMTWSDNEMAFMQGKAAMMMEDTYMINQLDNNFRWNQELEPFDWQMVTMPVDPASPDESPYISLNQVFAINQDAVNKRTAWEMIKLIHSPEMAKASSKIMDGGLSARITYTKEIKGKDGSALTMLKPKTNNRGVYDSLGKLDISYEFYNDMQTMIAKVVDDMVAGKSADEVLVPLQQELQKSLEQAKLKGSEQPVPLG